MRHLLIHPQHISQAAVIRFELTTTVNDARHVYMYGNFNGWKIHDGSFKLRAIGPGMYRLDLRREQINYPFNYKYHKGDIDQEELDELGNVPPVRRLLKTEHHVIDSVPRWRHNRITCDPFYLPRKYIIEDDFEIPQLNKRRRIWALLPHDYDSSTKRYPVLYLQDAQNLFNEKAPFGNWAIDEKLAILAETGYGDVIIVAVEHGEKDRITEYSPFDTKEFGSGEGVAYAAFMHDTLKPYIDKNFRTKPQRIHTGIGGSSMGGLISVFTGLRYPNNFAKWMIFSPSLWLSSKIFENIKTHKNQHPTFIYLFGGKRESKTMEKDLLLFTDILDRKTSLKQSLHYKLSIHPTATHSEKYWGAEFPRAIKWLFYDHIDYEN